MQYLELEQTQTLNMLPSCMIALVLSNDRMSKMKCGSFNRLDFLERPLWSMVLLETTLVSPEVHVVFSGPIAARCCVDVHGPRYH